jgi:hypothetical protein
MRVSFVVLAALLCALPLAAQAKEPADVFKGRIVLSTKPFPIRFKSDADFIAHMKKVDTKAFKYEGAEALNVEFMAFFAEPVQATQLEAKIYDITERRELKDTFPVYPGGRGMRTLASNFELRSDLLDTERRYHIVLTEGFRGRVLAETEFVVKRSAGDKDKAATPAGSP